MTERDRIGAAIRVYRIAANLTQKELADRLAMSPRTIMNWENGHHAPQWFNLNRVCSVLGIKLSDLFQLKEDRRVR